MSDQVNLYGYVLALSVPTAVTQQQDRAACYNILIDDNKLLDYVDVIRLGNETLTREALHDKAEIHFAKIGSMLSNQEYRLKRAVDQEVMMYADFADEMTQCDPASLQKVPAILMNLNTTRLRDHVQTCMHDVVSPAGQMANNLVVESVRAYLDSPNRVTVDAHRQMDWAKTNMEAALVDCDPNDDVVIKYDTEFKDNLTRMAEITGHMAQLESTLVDQLSDRDTLRDTLTDIATQFSEFNVVRDRVYNGINELDRYRESLPAKEIQAAVESLEASIAEWVDGEPIDAAGADENGLALESDKPNIVVRIWNWIVEQIKAFGKWIAKVWEQFVNFIKKRTGSLEKDLSDLEKDIKTAEKESGEPLTVTVASNDVVKELKEASSAIDAAARSAAIVDKPVVVENTSAVDKQVKTNDVIKAKLDESGDTLTKKQITDAYKQTLGPNEIQSAEKDTEEKSANVLMNHLDALAIIQAYVNKGSLLSSVRNELLKTAGSITHMQNITIRSGLTTKKHLCDPAVAPVISKSLSMYHTLVSVKNDLEKLAKDSKKDSSYKQFEDAYKYVHKVSGDVKWDEFKVAKLMGLLESSDNPEIASVDFYAIKNNYHNVLDVLFEPEDKVTRKELFTRYHNSVLDNTMVVDETFVKTLARLKAYIELVILERRIYLNLEDNFTFEVLKSAPKSIVLITRDDRAAKGLITEPITYAYSKNIHEELFKRIDTSELERDFKDGKFAITDLMEDMTRLSDFSKTITEDRHTHRSSRLNDMSDKIKNDPVLRDQFTEEEISNISKNIATSTKLMSYLFMGMAKVSNDATRDMKSQLTELRAIVRNANKGK